MEKKITQKFLETAIAISRMYGVAETLSDLPNVPQEKLTPKICDWTEEFLQSDEDMVVFIGNKIGKLEKEKGLH